MDTRRGWHVGHGERVCTAVELVNCCVYVVRSQCILYDASRERRDLSSPRNHRSLNRRLKFLNSAPILLGFSAFYVEQEAFFCIFLRDLASSALFLREKGDGLDGGEVFIKPKLELFSLPFFWMHPSQKFFKF